jgi:hypothetical protein
VYNRRVVNFKIIMMCKASQKVCRVVDLKKI